MVMVQDRLEPDLLVSMYRQMLLIRRFEEKCAEMYALAKIGGFCHLYIGQEAVAVGSTVACRPTDYIITAYRDHGHCLARGSEPQRVMAELFGKVTGLCKGKGGSMHLFDRPRRFYGGYAIVGGHIPVATGIAFAVKYRQENDVVLCFFGEGAVPTGIFHESLNMASLWSLPILYICENNRYGMGTPQERASALYNVGQAAGAYDLPHESLDGMDVQDVYHRVKAGVERVRALCRPHFIEARTYRFMGHSMSDPAHGHYRTKEDIDQWKSRDPIPNLVKQLMVEGILTQESMRQIEKEIEQIVHDAVDFADRSPFPSSEELNTDLFA